MSAIYVFRLLCAYVSFFHRQMKPASSEPRYVLSTDTFGEVVKMMAELNMGHIWVRFHRARFSLFTKVYAGQFCIQVVQDLISMKPITVVSKQGLST